jgi:hypothetical protein
MERLFCRGNTEEVALCSVTTAECDIGFREIRHKYVSVLNNFTS